MTKTWQTIQKQFIQFVRDPTCSDVTLDVMPARANMYRSLCFKNIKRLLETQFPVLREVLPTDTWEMLVDDFFKSHVCQSPWFSDMGKQFLDFYQDKQLAELAAYPWFYELAHYEWVELALDITDIALEELTLNDNVDLLEVTLMTSPLAWLLNYQYPVHKICLDYLPDKPEETYLIVSRNHKDEVEFLEINAVTAFLFNTLYEVPQSGKAALRVIATEMSQYPESVVYEHGLDTLNQLYQAGILREQ